MAPGLDPNSNASGSSAWLGAVFRIDDADGCAVVVASGEIDLATSPGLASALAEAQHSSARVIIDLSEVTFLDSSGINVMLAALKRSQPHGLGLVGPTAVVRKVLEITQLTTFVPVYASVKEAAENLG